MKWFKSKCGCREHDRLEREIENLKGTVQGICKHGDMVYRKMDDAEFYYATFYKECKTCGKRIYIEELEFLEMEYFETKKLARKQGEHIKRIKGAKEKFYDKSLTYNNDKDYTE